MLEGIGLLRTFVNNNHDETVYLFKIQSPLSLRLFFKNQLLQTMLYESLGQDEFDRTKNYFKKRTENISSYEELTSSFQDVFYVDLKKKNGTVLNVKDFFDDKTYNHPKIDYDMNLLYSELRNYQIPKSLFSKEDENIIKQLAVVYSVDVLSMASMIKDSIIQKKLNHDELRKQAKKFHNIDSSAKLKEVYLKQPLQYKINDNNQSTLIQHLKYLESITPYELLKEKQGGKEPVFHDLLIVETLMIQLGLKPAVVNVLIEYVLGTNNNRLSRTYCEAIGSSWARKNIVNAKDAYDEAMNNKKDKELIIDIEENSDNSVLLNNDSQGLIDLINELKEGKI